MATQWTMPTGYPGASQEPVESPIPVVPAGAKDDPSTPFFDARDDDGSFAKEGTPVKEAPKKSSKAAVSKE